MDDPKRIDSLERTVRDHARRIGDLEVDTKRQASETDRRVQDMIDAGTRHIEKVVASQAAQHSKAMGELTTKIDEVSKTTSQTFGHTIAQTSTLSDVHEELALAREERIKRKAVEEYERAQKKEQLEKEKRQREAEARRVKKWIAIGAVVVPLVGLLVYMIGTFIALERHEVPERFEPQTHEGR